MSLELKLNIKAQQRRSNIHVLDPFLWLKAYRGITKTSVNNVSDWKDFRGRDLSLAQGTDGLRPVFTEDQLNGYPTIVFDGIDNYLQGAFGEDLAQPNTIIYVGTEPTDNGSFRIIHDGDDTNKRHALTQDGSANRYTLFADNPITMPYVLSTGFKVMSAVYNGASSVFRVNGVDKTGAGDIGVDVLDGITLGTRFDGSSTRCADIAAVELIVLNKGLSTAELEAAENQLSRQYKIA